MMAETFGEGAVDQDCCSEGGVSVALFKLAPFAEESFRSVSGDF